MSIDKGESIDVIYLDFAKAFDKVLHRRLLAKVEGTKTDKQLAI